MNVYKDGNQFCAVHSDFINLQESLAGFGSTEEKAKLDLQKKDFLTN
jgi:hypothetical protein